MDHFYMTGEWRAGRQPAAGVQSTPAGLSLRGGAAKTAAPRPS